MKAQLDIHPGLRLNREHGKGRAFIDLQIVDLYCTIVVTLCVRIRIAGHCAGRIDIAAAIVQDGRGPSGRDRSDRSCEGERFWTLVSAVIVDGKPHQQFAVGIKDR